MLFLKYTLMIAGAGLLSAAAALLIRDLYLLFRLREKEELPEPPALDLSWGPTVRIAAPGFAALLVALAIVVVPAGYGGVRVSQVSGVLPGTLYPGAHFVWPLIEHVERYSTRDLVHNTLVADDSKREIQALRVQTREG